jgi:actin-related protein
MRMDENSLESVSRRIKESFCYVPFDIEGSLEKRTTKKSLYELPDGNSLEIEEETRGLGDLMFSPQKIGLDMEGLGDMCKRSISKCDIDIRKPLYQSIVLAGGNTNIPGFETRLISNFSYLDELNSESNTRCKFFKNDKRIISNWLGGALMSSVSEFQNLCITKEEYYENGPISVNRKFI